MGFGDVCWGGVRVRKEGRLVGTFTAAAAWPGGLRSVERFAAVGEAGEEGEG